MEKLFGKDVIPLSVTGYVEAPLAYDAVWALALALNKSQTRYRHHSIHSLICSFSRLYDLVGRAAKLLSSCDLSVVCLQQE